MKNNARPFLYGILFTIIVAAISYLLSYVPVLSTIGALPTAIINYMNYRNSIGYPEPLRGGITFASKKLLRAAIILSGLKLNLYIIATDGLWLLLGGIFVILFSVFMLVLSINYLMVMKISHSY